MPDLTQTHPLYDELKPIWQEAYDFYQAGPAVTDPSAEGRNFLPKAVAHNRSVGSRDESRSRALLSKHERMPRASYIWPHPREDDDEWCERTRRAVHYPVTRHVTDIYVGGATRTPPKRGVEAGENGRTEIDAFWDRFYKNVDRKGTDIDAFYKSALSLAMPFSFMYAFVDKPVFGEQAPSKGHQIERGEVPYAYLATPLEVPNWRVDSAGEFEWIQVAEPWDDQRQPGDKYPSCPPLRMRLWYRDRTELWEAQRNDSGVIQGEWTRVSDPVEHSLGRVPVAMLYARRDYKMRRGPSADAMLASLPRLDRSVFNKTSLRDEVLYNQAFYLLGVPTGDAVSGKEVDIGPRRAFGYSAEGGAPVMLTPDAALILAHNRTIAEELQTIREYVGVGRGKAEHSKEERSAEALAHESRNESNRVVSLIDALQEFDNDLHALVALSAGEDAAERPPAAWSRDVSTKSVQAELNAALSIKALGVPAETLAAVLRPAVARQMREQGLSQKAIDEATKAITPAALEALSQTSAQLPEAA